MSTAIFKKIGRDWLTPSARALGGSGTGAGAGRKGGLTARRRPISDNFAPSMDACARPIAASFYAMSCWVGYSRLGTP
mgnify:CR=1 FL=1